MRRAVKSYVRDRPVLRAAALRVRALGRRLATAPPGLYTLCYHHVRRDEAAAFARQLAVLAGCGSFLGADAAVAALRAGTAATGRSFLVTFDDGYSDTVDVALPVLRDLGIPAVLFLVSDWLRAPPANGDAYMTASDAERWLAAGFTVGSHSASHPQISQLEAGAAAAEFTRSATALAALAGEPIRHFACPWGVPGRDYLPKRDPALAAAAGFETFFTTTRGVARGAGDLPELPRHVLEPGWPLHQLHALMGGGWIGRR